MSQFFANTRKSGPGRRHAEGRPHFEPADAEHLAMPHKMRLRTLPLMKGVTHAPRRLGDKA